MPDPGEEIGEGRKSAALFAADEVTRGSRARAGHAQLAQARSEDLIFLLARHAPHVVAGGGERAAKDQECDQ